MIDQVEKAIQQIRSLPPEQQREIAELIQAEIQWESTLSHSQDELAKLAKEAKDEHEQGKTSDKPW
ncbi:MAG: hypothetical protein BRD50_01850 [Bacteroidetes bacterium SW_11_45_7]|nr:MAG: hypothetical protein BRD50_01850 [Bacteroidetes bacterium SW_11_45_7]